jgi:2-polyprenyl-6-methoxyphenol hydroxylase-like FAD-dependent oxidoreductase
VQTSEQNGIAIIGGGIGGLALALALQRFALPATVCERAPELREVGAGILLTPNASWVLHRLGLLPQAAARGLVLKSWQILDRAGRVLQTFRFGGENASSISITRSALQQTLQEAIAPGKLRLGWEAVAVAPSRDGNAVHFAHGESLSASVVVGADGGKSVIGARHFSVSPPRRHGYVGWRALVDHVPAGWGDGLVSESWAEGCRFGIAPVGGDRCYWYATENTAPGWSLPAGERRSHLLKKFARWHRPVCDLIAATSEEDILLSDIVDRPPARRWQRGGVALLGDAAHLMTPNLGQGAAMALEDAWVLAQCLAQDGLCDRALERYERRRRPRATAIARLSTLVGRMIQLEQPLLWRLRNLALRCSPDRLGALALGPVFNFRV